METIRTKTQIVNSHSYDSPERISYPDSKPHRIQVVPRLIDKFHILPSVKNYFRSRDFIIKEPTGFGVKADFRILGGSSRRDKVELVLVESDPVLICNLNITKEKRYVFHFGNEFFLTTGRSIRKKSEINDGEKLRLISLDTIRKMMKIDIDLSDAY